MILVRQEGVRTMVEDHTFEDAATTSPDTTAPTPNNQDVLHSKAMKKEAALEKKAAMKRKQELMNTTAANKAPRTAISSDAHTAAATTNSPASASSSTAAAAVFPAVVELMQDELRQVEIQHQTKVKKLKVEFDARIHDARVEYEQNKHDMSIVQENKVVKLTKDAVNPYKFRMDKLLIERSYDEEIRTQKVKFNLYLAKLNDEQLTEVEKLVRKMQKTVRSIKLKSGDTFSTSDKKFAEELQRPDFNAHNLLGTIGYRDANLHLNRIIDPKNKQSDKLVVKAKSVLEDWAEHEKKAGQQVDDFLESMGNMDPTKYDVEKYVDSNRKVTGPWHVAYAHEFKQALETENEKPGHYDKAREHTISMLDWLIDMARPASDEDESQMSLEESDHEQDGFEQEDEKVQHPFADDEADEAGSEDERDEEKTSKEEAAKEEADIADGEDLGSEGGAQDKHDQERDARLDEIADELRKTPLMKLLDVKFKGDEDAIIAAATEMVDEYNKIFNNEPIHVMKRLSNSSGIVTRTLHGVLKDKRLLELGRRVQQLKIYLEVVRKLEPHANDMDRSSLVTFPKLKRQPDLMKLFETEIWDSIGSHDSNSAVLSVPSLIQAYRIFTPLESGEDDTTIRNKIVSLLKKKLFDFVVIGDIAIGSDVASFIQNELQGSSNQDLSPKIMTSTDVLAFIVNEKKSLDEYNKNRMVLDEEQSALDISHTDATTPTDTGVNTTLHGDLYDASRRQDLERAVGVLMQRVVSQMGGTSRVKPDYDDHVDADLDGNFRIEEEHIQAQQRRLFNTFGIGEQIWAIRSPTDPTAASNFIFNDLEDFRIADQTRLTYTNKHMQDYVTSMTFLYSVTGIAGQETNSLNVFKDHLNVLQGFLTDILTEEEPKFMEDVTNRSAGMDRRTRGAAIAASPASASALPTIVTYPTFRKLNMSSTWGALKKKVQSKIEQMKLSRDASQNVTIQ